MRYELQPLDNFLNTLNPLKYTACTADTDQIKEWNAYLQTEIDRVKLALLDQFISTQDDNILSRSLYRHQCTLISLADRACGFATARINQALSLPERQIKAFYWQTVDILGNLIEWFKIEFPKYFNWDCKLPDACKPATLPVIRNRMQLIKPELELSSLDQRLRIIFQNYFRELNHTADITYRKLGFAEMLIDGLSSVLDASNDQAEVNENIRDLLFRLDMNSLEVLEWYYHGLEDQLQSADGMAEQVELLIGEEEKLKGYYPAKIAYNQELPPLKKMALSYVKRKLSMIRKQHKIRRQEAELHSLPESSFRVQVFLTGTQLGFFIRALVSAGVIVGDNVKGLLGFMSKHVYSKKDKYITYKTLETAYYHPQPPVVNKVLESAIQMMNWVNSKKEKLLR